MGKTTALKKVIDGLGSARCGGFYTEQMRAANEVYGYQIVTLDGQTGTLADVAYDSPHRVGKYGILLPFFEHTGLISLSRALVSKRLVVIDEIGPMHLCSSLFQSVITDVLASAFPLLGTIYSGPGKYPWLDEIKQRDDVTVYELTDVNRDSLPQTLIEILREEYQSGLL